MATAIANRTLTCNSCKKEIDLDEEEFDRHKQFWKNNTNSLTANFICNKCLGLAKKGKIFETSSKTVEKEIIREVPFDPANTEAFQTLRNGLSNLWREYKKYVKEKGVNEEVVRVWRTKTETLLRQEGVSDPEFILETSSKQLNQKKTLVYPVEFTAVLVKIPFQEEKVELVIQSDILFFE